jgi:uncharacterized protein YjgD (DUF1641 family)
MSENNIQEQITGLNQKLDLILESIEEQKRHREEMDDLLSDLNIIVKDAFQHTVLTLEKSQVEFDHSGVPKLLVKLLQNVDTFYEMLEILESVKDFMKDISPVLHQMGLDAVNKMNELEQKGLFNIIRNLTQPDVIAALGRISKALAEVKMDESLDKRSIYGLMKQITSTDTRKSVSYTLRLLQAINKTEVEQV